MDKGYVKIYCGTGHGRSTAALGDALLCASRDERVVIVQFLKGKYTEETTFLRCLEPNIKIFRFEKEPCYYEKLSDEEKAEENQNIRNGLNFVHKVLSVGECDLLVLDEILGLVDLGIIDVQEIVNLLKIKSESVEIVMTGRRLPSELTGYADYISEFNVIKDEMNQSLCKG